MNSLNTWTRQHMNIHWFGTKSLNQRLRESNYEWWLGFSPGARTNMAHKQTSIPVTCLEIKVNISKMIRGSGCTRHFSEGFYAELVSLLSVWFWTQVSRNVIAKHYMRYIRSFLGLQVIKVPITEQRNWQSCRKKQFAMKFRCLTHQHCRVNGVDPEWHKLATIDVRWSWKIHSRTFI